mgnify:FL=1
MVAAHDAMAWNKNCYAVCPYGLRHGSDAFRIANSQGNIFVAHSLSVWYAEQCFPHLLLEIRSHKTQRDVESLAAVC